MILIDLPPANALLNKIIRQQHFRYFESFLRLESRLATKGVGVHERSSIDQEVGRSIKPHMRSTRLNAFSRDQTDPAALRLKHR